MHKSLTEKVRRKILTLQINKREKDIKDRVKEIRRIKAMMVLESIVTMPLYYPVVISYGYSRYLESSYECPPVAYLFGLIVIQGLVWIFLTSLIKKIRRLCQ